MATGAPNSFLEGERRPVTVLFADLVGFTAFAERSGEEAAFTLMKRITQVLTDAVEEHGGMINSFMGDGVMALFGVPHALEDAPLRACRAALLIHERLARQAAEIETSCGLRPWLRIGINTGLAVVARVEAGQSVGVTALGDTTNLAARLQALAEPGAVFLSEAVQRLVEGMVQSRFVGEHRIKGKAEPQLVYRLEAIRQGAQRFDAALSRGLTSYFGRDREVETLQRRLAETRAGIQVIDISGDPGIGKSRLLHEFRQRIGKTNVLVLSGSCSLEDQQTPFLPFIEIVRKSFRLAGSGEDQTEVARKLDDGLKALGIASAKNLGLLLHLLGLKPPEDSLQGLDGALIGFRTRDLLQQLLQVRCQISPVVMAIEDLHWIDSASEELLDQMTTIPERLPLMILHTRRPEYRPPWFGRAEVSHLPLEPLSKAETAYIIEERLGANALPEELRRLVSAKAEGNPLFAEELVSFLLERGIVRHGAGGLIFDTATVASTLPASLQSLLAARVDRLSPADRFVLQAAAVIGRRFDSDLLAVVAGLSGDIEAPLAAMQALDLVRRDDKAGAYTFKHALVRDAVYGSLLKSACAVLHLKIAEEVERRGANRLPEVVELLAYHYGRTSRADKAFQYLAAAGRKSLAVYSLDEAEQYCRKALHLIDTTPGCSTEQAVAEVIALMLEVLYLTGNNPAVAQEAERYMPRLEAMPDSPHLVIALGFYALTLGNKCDFRAGEAAANRALSIAERIGDARAEGYALVGLLFCATVLARCGASTGCPRIGRGD
jgi:class 3 adenylate cyclase